MAYLIEITAQQLRVVRQALATAPLIDEIDNALNARAEYAETGDLPEWAEEIAHHNTASLIAAIIMDDFDYITDEAVEQWHETRSLSIESEEQAFGVGHNLRAAKIAWVDLDSDI